MIPALMAAGFAAQALGTGINAYRSSEFLSEAQRQLRDLENNPIEPYKASTQLRTAYAGARAGAAAPKGMSMEDVNRFMINQARNENTALANAGKMGYGGRGNLAVLNAGLSGMSADMASKSAAMAQQNRQADLGRLQGLSSTYQTLSNMNANANIQAQQAYGRAIQQQRQNISGAWKSLADAGGMAAGYGMMGTSPKTTGGETDLTFLKYNPNTAPTAFKGFMNQFKSNSPFFKGTQDAAPYSFSSEERAYDGMMAAQPTAGYEMPNPVFMQYMRSQLTPNPAVAPLGTSPGIAPYSFSENPYSGMMSAGQVPATPAFMNYMRSQLTPGFK